MWVIIKKGFAGEVCGEKLLLAPGIKYDLNPSVVEALRNERLLGKGNVIKSCPPWEEHLDKKAAKKNLIIADANAAIKKAQVLDARCSELENLIGKGTIELKKLLPELEDAEGRARKLAKEAGIEWPPKAKSKDTGKSERQTDASGQES